MRVLIAEDDPKISNLLATGFRDHGIDSYVAENGDEAVDAVYNKGPFDVIVLDVMMPGYDGYNVLTLARNRGVGTPVIFLTAKDAIADRIKGLNLGADDYLVKPFAFAELLARVRSLARRASSQPDTIIKIGDLEIDTAQQSAVRAGRRIDLTAKEFALLNLLAKCAGESVSRSFIAARVWDVTFEAESNVVDVHVRRLRAKVDDPFDARMIFTVRGVGYMLKDPS